ncbi:MAG: glycosyl hydrolase [Blastocatellia bacterium]|nr:glycosyl hydrolase [Blastocatellia bacterium]
MQAVRTHDYYGPLDMASIYPNQNADPTLVSSYNFTESDRMYRAILENGFEPYIRLGNSYNNSGPVTNQANFVRACLEVVKHYIELSKSYSKQLHYVEIWNEPDNSHFWRGSPQQFYSLFIDIFTTLKQNFPELKVGGPGFAPSGYLALGGINFTKGFLDALRARGIKLDFFSWHVYTNNPAEFTKGYDLLYPGASSSWF